MEILGGVIDSLGDSGFDDGWLACGFMVEDHGRVSRSFFGERRLNIVFECQCFFLSLNSVELF